MFVVLQPWLPFTSCLTSPFAIAQKKEYRFKLTQGWVNDDRIWNHCFNTCIFQKTYKLYLCIFNEMWAKPTVTIWTAGIKCIMLGTVWLHLSLSFIPSLFGGQPAPSLSRAQFPVNACRLPGLSCCQLSAISLLERIAIKTSLFLRSWKKTDLPYTNHQIPPPPTFLEWGGGCWSKFSKLIFACNSAMILQTASKDVLSAAMQACAFGCHLDHLQEYRNRWHRHRKCQHGCNYSDHWFQCPNLKINRFQLKKHTFIMQ